MGAQTSSFEGDVPNLADMKRPWYGTPWDGSVKSFRLESTSAPSRFRIKHLPTGLYLSIDSGNNGILDGSGVYFSVHTPDDIYNPLGLNAHALKIESGPRTGTFLRHSGMIAHGDPWEGSNYDFSWVFVFFEKINGQIGPSFTISNYYGSVPGQLPYFLDTDGSGYVQIIEKPGGNNVSLWASSA